MNRLNFRGLSHCRIWLAFVSSICPMWASFGICRKRDDSIRSIWRHRKCQPDFYSNFLPTSWSAQTKQNSQFLHFFSSLPSLKNSPLLILSFGEILVVIVSYKTWEVVVTRRLSVCLMIKKSYVWIPPDAGVIHLSNRSLTDMFDHSLHLHYVCL